MKKNILISSCLISAALLVASQAGATAKKNFYLSIPFGYDFVTKPKSNDGSFADAKLKNTPFVGLAAGYDFGVARAELSFGYRNNMKFTNNDSVSFTGGFITGKYSTMSVKAYSFMADLYKDFDIGSDFSPYIGAGVGFTRFKTGDYTFSRYDNDGAFMNANTTAGKASTSFSWRLGAGMNYKLSESVDVGLGYAFNNLGKIKRDNPNASVGGVHKVKFTSHEIVANVKFKF